jgi:hypothetical protein
MESTGAGGVAALDRPPWLPAAGADAVWQAGGGVVGFRELRRSLGRGKVARNWSEGGRGGAARARWRCSARPERRRAEKEMMMAWLHIKRGRLLDEHEDDLDDARQLPASLAHAQRPRGVRVRGCVFLNPAWCMPGRGVRAKERGGGPTAVHGPPRRCRGQPYTVASRGRHVAHARRTGHDDGVRCVTFYST